MLKIAHVNTITILKELVLSVAKCISDYVRQFLGKSEDHMYIK